MISIKDNILLAPHTTFGIGGNAKFFAEAGSVEELKEAIKFSKDKTLPVFILGGGSNILISDEGFEGLVIKMNIRGLWITDLRSRLSTGVVLRAGAGEVWDDVVAKGVELNAGGLENLSLIPGTVGGAVYQNIGAYGAELKDVLDSVSVFDISTGDVVRLSNEECGFGYRSSIFKKNKNLIILEAELSLFKNWKPNLSYPDLQKYFKDQVNDSTKLSYDSFVERPALNEIRQVIIKIRRNKLPYPDEVGNAGSFFKNPVISHTTYHILHTKHPDLKGHDIGNGLVKLSAAQLIEKCGFKGKRVGNVGVSEKHALVLVNYGGGTAKELAILEATIRGAVEAKFGIKLEAEVEKGAF